MNMNIDTNKKVWVGIILVIVFMGIWALYSWEMNPDGGFNLFGYSLQKNMPEKPDTATKNAVTFSSLFKQPGSHICTYEQVSQTSKTSGAVYIADGKMRAEFRTTAGDTVSANMMVYNYGTLYTWKEGSGTGTKSQLNSVSELPFIVPKDLTSGSVLGSGLNSVSWDCHDWMQNNTLLAPPKTVKFY